MYACVCVCMYAKMHVCMFVCMYVCMYVSRQCVYNKSSVTESVVYR